MRNAGKNTTKFVEWPTKRLNSWGSRKTFSRFLLFLLRVRRPKATRKNTKPTANKQRASSSASKWKNTEIVSRRKKGRKNKRETISFVRLLCMHDGDNKFNNRFHSKIISHKTCGNLDTVGNVKYFNATFIHQVAIKY